MNETVNVPPPRAELESDMRVLDEIEKNLRSRKLQEENNAKQEYQAQTLAVKKEYQEKILAIKLYYIKAFNDLLLKRRDIWSKL
jgi:hypothetical protein